MFSVYFSVSGHVAVRREKPAVNLPEPSGKMSSQAESQIRYGTSKIKRINYINLYIKLINLIKLIKLSMAQSLKSRLHHFVSSIWGRVRITSFRGCEGSHVRTAQGPCKAKGFERFHISSCSKRRKALKRFEKISPGRDPFLLLRDWLAVLSASIEWTSFLFI